MLMVHGKVTFDTVTEIVKYRAACLNKCIQLVVLRLAIGILLVMIALIAAKWQLYSAHTPPACSGSILKYRTGSYI